MALKDSIKWFKKTFHAELEAAVQGTPYCVDLLAAVAYQETGYIWSSQIKKLSVPELLKICVGDTLDYPKRRAFPKNKAALVAVPRGKDMFKVAREALELVGEHNTTFGRVAKKYPSKFCRGFGIFQYDLQFFKEDPEYFLQKKWHVFDVCVNHCVQELRAAQRRQGWSSKTELSDYQKAIVAIAYNRGRAKLSLGLKQGYKSGGKHYGENIASYLKIAQSIKVKPAPAGDPAVPPKAIVVPIGITSQLYRVAVNSSLSLREGPGTNYDRLARMPPGQLVQRISGADGDAWWEVEAPMDPGPIRGFCASKYLKPATVAPVITEGDPEPVDFKNVPGYIRREVEQPDGVIESGEKGKRVRRVQEWLCFHNCKTGTDEEFGAATTQCVEDFQKKKGLPVTGKVTGPTWKALVAPMRAALAEPKGMKTKTLAAAIHAVAMQHLKQHPIEIGGANRGPWVRLYCRGNDGSAWAWCAGFVTLLMKQACFYRGHKPPIQGSESCDVLAAQAKAAGLFVHESDISSGNFDWSEFGRCGVFLRRRTSTDWTHTGFGFDGDGNTFKTIEGNTNDEGSREGYEACKRTRSIAGSNYDFIRFV